MATMPTAMNASAEQQEASPAGGTAAAAMPPLPPPPQEPDGAPAPMPPTAKPMSNKNKSIIPVAHRPSDLEARGTKMMEGRKKKGDKQGAAGKEAKTVTDERIVEQNPYTLNKAPNGLVYHQMGQLQVQPQQQQAMQQPNQIQMNQQQMGQPQQQHQVTQQAYQVGMTNQQQQQQGMMQQQQMQQQGMMQQFQPNQPYNQFMQPPNVGYPQAQQYPNQFSPQLQQYQNPYPHQQVYHNNQFPVQHQQFPQQMQYAQQPNVVMYNMPQFPNQQFPQQQQQQFPQQQQIMMNNNIQFPQQQQNMTNTNSTMAQEKSEKVKPAKKKKKKSKAHKVPNEGIELKDNATLPPLPSGKKLSLQIQANESFEESKTSNLKGPDAQVSAAKGPSPKAAVIQGNTTKSLNKIPEASLIPSPAPDTSCYTVQKPGPSSNTKTSFIASEQENLFMALSKNCEEATGGSDVGSKQDSALEQFASPLEDKDKFDGGDVKNATTEKGDEVKAREQVHKKGSDQDTSSNLNTKSGPNTNDKHSNSNAVTPNEAKAVQYDVSDRIANERVSILAELQSNFEAAQGFRANEGKSEDGFISQGNAAIKDVVFNKEAAQTEDASSVKVSHEPKTDLNTQGGNNSAAPKDLSSNTGNSSPNIDGLYSNATAPNEAEAAQGNVIENSANKYTTTLVELKSYPKVNDAELKSGPTVKGGYVSPGTTIKDTPSFSSSNEGAKTEMSPYLAPNAFQAKTAHKTGDVMMKDVSTDSRSQQAFTTHFREVAKLAQAQKEPTKPAKLPNAEHNRAMEVEEEGDDDWNLMFVQLKEYKRQFGNVQVPKPKKSEKDTKQDGWYEVFVWAKKQRTKNRRGTLCPQRWQKLYDLGFDFNGQPLQRVCDSKKGKSIPQIMASASLKSVPNSLKTEPNLKFQQSTLTLKPSAQQAAQQKMQQAQGIQGQLQIGNNTQTQIMQSQIGDSVQNQTSQPQTGSNMQAQFMQVQGAPSPWALNQNLQMQQVNQPFQNTQSSLQQFQTNGMAHETHTQPTGLSLQNSQALHQQQFNPAMNNMQPQIQQMMIQQPTTLAPQQSCSGAASLSRQPSHQEKTIKSNTSESSKVHKKGNSGPKKLCDSASKERKSSFGEGKERENKTEDLRTGKFTAEEIKYSLAVISDFKSGLLDALPGQNISKFLAKKLNRSYPNISKQFPSIVHLKPFAPITIKGSDDKTEDEVEEARKRIRALFENYQASVKKTAGKVAPSVNNEAKETTPKRKVTPDSNVGNEQPPKKAKLLEEQIQAKNEEAGHILQQFNGAQGASQGVAAAAHSNISTTHSSAASAQSTLNFLLTQQQFPMLLNPMLQQSLLQPQQQALHQHSNFIIQQYQNQDLLQKARFCQVNAYSGVNAMPQLPPPNEASLNASIELDKEDIAAEALCQFRNTGKGS